MVGHHDQMQVTQGTFVTPELEMRNPFPAAVQVTPLVADTHWNGPTAVVSP